MLDSGYAKVKDEARSPPVPRHVAIVMDGNGRWARRKRRPRTFGHRAGQKAVRTSVEFCLQHGIEALTLFAFSSENWQRPKQEVSALVQLFLNALASEVDDLHANGVRVTFIGELEGFAITLRESMHAAMDRTRGNSRLHLNVAVNYGGRWDIANAARLAAGAVERGELTADAISERTLARWLCLADLPPVDLFVRTGGEMRISNFLLWQVAYAELYFTDTLWPDMDAAAFGTMLDAFARRERRFGMTTEQIRESSGGKHS